MIAFSIEDYMYHTLAAKGSGELCLKYIFSFGAFARMPLLHWYDILLILNISTCLKSANL